MDRIVELIARAVVTEMPRDFPVEQDVLHLGASADVVDDHITLIVANSVDDNTNVGDASSQIPGDEISRLIVMGKRGYRQGFSVTLKKDDQIRHPAMINIRIGVAQKPVPFCRIRREIVLHVFVDFFLQIDTYGTVRADDFVGTNTCVSGHIAARVRDANISRIVADGVMGSLNSRGNQCTQKLLVRCGCMAGCLCQ